MVSEQSTIYGVIGSGSWGTAFAHLLGQREEVYLWGRNESLIKQIQVDRVNDQYLPDVELPYEVRATYDLDHVLADSDVLIGAVPSHAFANVLDRIAPQLDTETPFVNLAKGFDPDSGCRLSEVYRDKVGQLDNYFLLTGPSHAGEVGKKRPTTVVLGGQDEQQRRLLQEQFYRDYFRVYTNSDLIGLEMGGALKNVIAIASGISDGLGFGVNARAALVTRGMQDLRRLVEHEGGDPNTLMGLSGLGDLIVTATSDLSRNYRLGNLIAVGHDLDSAREQVGQVVEGVNTARLAKQRIDDGNLSAPVIVQTSRILFEGLDPDQAVQQLMTRDLRPEFARSDE